MKRTGRGNRAEVRLEPWGEGDLPLLEKLNEPEMTEHVGGPETPKKLADRQARYEESDSRQYRIVEPSSGERVGWVGYWETTHDDDPVWEIGWAVIPSFQGRGIASAATAQLLERSRSEQRHRYVHAFPRVENAPSNAICRRLGFELLGEIDFPARQGGSVRCNDWRIDLLAEGRVRAGP